MNASNKPAVMIAGAVVVAGLALFAAQTTLAEDPEEAPHNSFISVSGTVVATAPDAFRLDYGDGVITVEMDDYDFYPEGYALLANDQVQVFGVIDDDLFEKRTIEASSVYVENLGTHFFASSADEEDFAPWTIGGAIHPGEVEVTGEVTKITGRHFTVDTGLRRVLVDTTKMPYNPLDDDGYLKIDVGDEVKVGGDIDRNLFNEHEIEVDWIIGLEA